MVKTTNELYFAKSSNQLSISIFLKRLHSAAFGKNDHLSFFEIPSLSFCDISLLFFL